MSNTELEMLEKEISEADAEISYEAMDDKADEEAREDEMVSSERNLSESDIEDSENEDGKNLLIVKLKRKYSYAGKEYEEIDLSNLANFTVVDGELLDRIMLTINHSPRNKFTDFTYCKHVAMRATGLPAEFFNRISYHDMLNVMAVIRYFFIVG